MKSTARSSRSKNFVGIYEKFTTSLNVLKMAITPMKMHTRNTEIITK